MEEKKEKQPVKKEWRTPELREHGSLTDLTQVEGFDPEDTNCWIS